MQANSKQILHVWLAGLFLASTRFWQFFFDKTIFFGDNFSLMVPGKLFTITWLRQGILPLWNPLLFAGISWIGDVNQSMLYPSTLLFLVFSPATALNMTILAHVLLTFAGAYFLARRLAFSKTASYLVAILWSCSPQIAGSINNIATLQSLSFLPWIVWAGVAKRHTIRSAISLGLLVALQLLGGYPQYVLYAVTFSFILSLSWRWETKFIRTWLLAGIIAVGASAIVWLPFLPTLANSTRVVQSLDQAAAGSLSIGELIHVILPTFFYNPIVGIKWGLLWNAQPNIVVYFGWFGLLLLGFSLRNLKRAPLFIRTLWIVAVVSLLFAFGDVLPWFSFLSKIPLLGASRGASGILQLTAFAGALLIGWSFDQCKPKKSLRWRYVLWSVSALAMLSGIGWLVMQSGFSPIWHKADQILSGRLSLSPFHTLARDFLLLSNILRSFVITSAVLAASLFFWLQKKYTLLLICIAFDLIFNTAHLFFFAPREIYSIDSTHNEITSLMQAQDLTQYRVLTRNYNTPYTDFGAYWDALAVRQPFSDSYIDADELNNYSHLQRMRSGATPDWNMVFGVPVINGYTTLLPLDVHERFAATNSTETSINNLPEIAVTNEALSEWSVGYYVRDTWFPLYGATMPEDIVAKTENLTLYQLPAQPRFRTAETGFVYVKDLLETPNQIRFVATASETSKMIIADRYDKDWRATVNGHSVKISNHNGMRLLPVEHGTNRVQMWYEPRMFYYGLGISSLTLLVVMIGLFAHRSKP